MGIADDLERLAALHRSGSLSDAEFASAKARVLAASDAATAAPSPTHGLHALRRSRVDRWLGGVCGGLGVATDVPSWVWRLAFLVLALCGGCGFVIYLLAWILLPSELPAVDVGGAGAYRST